MDCKHENFSVNADVTRLANDKDESEIVGYTMDLSVCCADCYKPFSFIGLPLGLSASYPTTDVEKVTARIPIEPVI